MSKNESMYLANWNGRTICTKDFEIELDRYSHFYNGLSPFLYPSNCSLLPHIQSYYTFHPSQAVSLCWRTRRRSPHPGKFLLAWFVRKQSQNLWIKLSRLYIAIVTYDNHTSLCHTGQQGRKPGMKLHQGRYSTPIDLCRDLYRWAFISSSECNGNTQTVPIW